MIAGAGARGDGSDGQHRGGRPPSRSSETEGGDLRVAVLKGGTSLERAVSLRSGARAQRALRALGYDVVAIDAGPELVSALLEAKPDAAFIALHGRDGEDGGVQGMLEALQIPYTGSGPSACMRCTDKVLAKHLMREAGIPTPDFVSFKETAIKELGVAAALPSVEQRLGFPVVVKPASQGSALGIKFARSHDELPGAIVGALSYDRKVLIERHVQGRDLAVSLLDARTLEPGVLPAVAGASRAVGGASQATGGASRATGGASRAAGGASQTAGGASQTAGGASQTAGGASRATGKAPQATPGASEPVALPVVEAIPREQNFYSYESRYEIGMTTFESPAKLPAALSARAQELALQAYDLFGCHGVARVDLMLSEQAQELTVLEVNVVPGLTETSLLPLAGDAAQVGFEEIVARILASAFTRQ